MGKEDKELEDDKSLDNAEIPGNDEQDRQDDAPKDIRGALKNAFKEASEKDEDGQKEDDKQEDTSTNEQKTKRSRAKSDRSDAKVLPKSDNEQGDSEKSESTDEDNKTKEEKTEASKIEPPPYWKNKGKSVWDKLSDQDKNLLVAREKEVSDGFAQISQKVKSFDEMEKVLAPRAQTIQQFGVSQAQVVDRLFSWMEALGHPNPSVKYNSFKELANSFGIDIAQLSPKQPQSQDGEVETDPNTPPEWFSEYVQNTEAKIGALNQSITSQQQAAADAYVSNWASNKPHYSKVSQLMGQLVASGVVPLKNGQVDLDGAYEKAILLHPEVSAQIQLEAEEKAKADAKAKADKEAKEKADKLARAKKAGAGLKPAAPSQPLQSAKLNGKNKPTSVKDSIRAALEDLRE